MERDQKERQEREEERKERERERREEAQRHEQERKDTQAMFLRLLENRDEKFKELEKSRSEEMKEVEKRRLEQEKTLNEEQLKFERERLQKEEELRTEQMKVEERLFAQLQTAEQATLAQSDKSKTGLKLPFLKMPTFNGDLLKWLEFWDMFSATVHDNPDLSPVQKLSHLKANLEGPAQESISQLAMINDNYDVAVQLLKKRCGNRRVIEEKLFGKLQSLPTSSMRLEDLRRTFHTVEQSLEQLKNLDDQFAQGTCEVKMLINMVKQKFPPEIIVEIEEEQKDDWTLKDLMTKVEHFITKHERKANLKMELYGQKSAGSSPQISQPNSKGYVSPQSTFKGNYSTTPRSSAESLASFSTGMEPDRISTANRKPRPCAFCGDEHHLSEMCLHYPTEKQRKDLMYILKKCFICLKPGHMLKECKHPIKDKACPDAKKLVFTTVLYAKSGLDQNWSLLQYE